MSEQPEDEIENNIVTTPEELEVYTISKLILKDTVVLDRYFTEIIKVTLMYSLDNNIRKWILKILHE